MAVLRKDSYILCIWNIKRGKLFVSFHYQFLYHIKTFYFSHFLTSFLNFFEMFSPIPVKGGVHPRPLLALVDWMFTRLNLTVKGVPSSFVWFKRFVLTYLLSTSKVGLY